MLATQWQHRESTDIDLKLDPKSGLMLLNPRYDPSFDEKMVALGCERPLHQKDQIIIPVGKEGKIDLFEGPTVPGKGHYAAEVQGHDEQVLSNAQILAGKVIGRGFESPTRDVYDLAIAAETDPVALEIAINCIPEATWQETLVRWREAAPSHARAAKEQLRNVPPQWEHVAEDPASAAIERGKGRRYTRLTIEWNNGQLEIKTECADQRERLRRIDTVTREGIADELERCGVNEYLNSRTGGGAETILNRIAAARASRTAQIYESASVPETPGVRKPSRTPSGTAGTVSLTLDGGADSQEAAERANVRDEQARRIKRAIKKTERSRDRHQVKGPEPPH